jgi:hypothetical protein
MNLTDTLYEYLETEKTLEALKDSLEKAGRLLISKVHQELTIHLNEWGLGLLVTPPKYLTGEHETQLYLRLPSVHYVDEPTPGSVVPVKRIWIDEVVRADFKLLEILLPEELYKAVLVIKARPDIEAIDALSVDILLPEDPLVWLIYKDDVIQLSFSTEEAKAIRGEMYGPVNQKLARAFTEGYVVNGKERAPLGSKLLDLLPYYGWARL